MTNPRLKLPSRNRPDGDIEPLEGIIQDPLPIRLPGSGGIEDSKVELAKLQVAKEALKTVSAFMNMCNSYINFKATETEWRGRIETAELDLQKAEIELQNALSHNQVRLKELAHAKEAQERLLNFFDHMLDTFKKLPADAQQKAESRQLLLQLSEQIVRLKVR